MSVRLPPSPAAAIRFYKYPLSFFSLPFCRYDPFAKGAKIYIQVALAKGCRSGCERDAPTTAASSGASAAAEQPACPPAHPAVLTRSLCSSFCAPHSDMVASPATPAMQQADPNSPPMLRAPPNVTYFRGRVNGRPGSQVLVHVTANGTMIGEMRDGRKKWSLFKPAPRRGGPRAGSTRRLAQAAADVPMSAVVIDNNTLSGRGFDCGYGPETCAPKPAVPDEWADNATAVQWFTVRRPGGLFGSLGSPPPAQPQINPGQPQR